MDLFAFQLYKSISSDIFKGQITFSDPVNSIAMRRFLVIISKASHLTSKIRSSNMDSWPKSVLHYYKIIYKSQISCCLLYYKSHIP